MKVQIVYFNETLGKTVAAEDPAVSICKPTSDAGALTYYVVVDFIADHGDIPALLVDTSALRPRGRAKVHVFHEEAITAATDGRLVAYKGTTERLPCSGRGLCNRVTGKCECFKDYYSSDGLGGAGKRDDCGHIYKSGGIVGLDFESVAAEDKSDDEGDDDNT